MSQTTEYAFTYLGEFLTPEERQAYRVVVAHRKADGSQSPDFGERLQKLWASRDPEWASREAAVAELLKDGDEAFLIATRERLLADPTVRRHFNLCPRCGAIPHTPRARQCPACFHTWREPAQNPT